MKWVSQIEETAFSTLRKKKGKVEEQKHEHGTEWLDQGILEAVADREAQPISRASELHEEFGIYSEVKEKLSRTDMSRSDVHCRSLTLSAT